MVDGKYDQISGPRDLGGRPRQDKTAEGGITAVRYGAKKIEATGDQ